MDISIVIPVLNQLDFTRQCLDSLFRHGYASTDIIVIDNGSADGTAEYLASQKSIRVITNEQNRGCAPAWNQGWQAAQRTWIVILNNDVLVTAGCLEGLLQFAEQRKCDIVSPAIREFELNYNLDDYAREFTSKMGSFERMGIADGICFMVARRVFETVGGFDEQFRIGQYEDKDFFRRAVQAGFRLGTTGRSFIHHFGSITQKAISNPQIPSPSVNYRQVNRAYYMAKWNLPWYQRGLERLWLNLRMRYWRTRERLYTGHSLKEKWERGQIQYY